MSWKKLFCFVSYFVRIKSINDFWFSIKQISCLTLFKMGALWGWVGVKNTTLTVFLCNFYRRWNRAKMFWLLVLTLSHTGIKFQVHTLYQSQIIELEPETTLNKIGFSGQTLKKLRPLPLFIRGKLGTSKIDCGAKFRRSHVCLYSPTENRLWQLMSLLFFVMLW